MITAPSIIVAPRCVWVLSALLRQWKTLTPRTASAKGRFLLREVCSSDHLKFISIRSDVFRPSSVQCIAYLQEIFGRFEDLKMFGPTCVQKQMCQASIGSEMNQGPGVYQILGLSGEREHNIMRTTEFLMFATVKRSPAY